MAPAPVLFLNLGGVGNLTWVDPSAAGPEQGCLAFDTGPANAPINDMIRARGLGARDEGGALAARGRADPAIVDDFLRHPYFARTPPKSLDRDAFAGLSRAVAELDAEDAAATLVAALAASVVAGFDHLPSPPEQVLVCGGGRHNAAIMAALSSALLCEVLPVEAIGLDGDMLVRRPSAGSRCRCCAGCPPRPGDDRRAHAGLRADHTPRGSESIFPILA